jgi:hypothetical protein
MATYHGTQVKVAVKSTTPAYTDAAATTDFTLNYDSDIVDVFAHGSRLPAELKDGHVKITGTLQRDFTTGNFSAAGVTFFAMATGVTSFHIAIFPEGDALPKIDAEDCHFGGWSLKAPLNGIVQESCKFEALLITPTE